MLSGSLWSVSYTHLDVYKRQMLEELKVRHRIVVTLEDGVLDGGFGEKIARYYGNSEMRSSTIPTGKVLL